MYENVERRLNNIAVKYSSRRNRDMHIVNAVYMFAVVMCIVAAGPSAPQYMKELGYCLTVVAFLKCLYAMLWWVYISAREEFFKIYFMVMLISAIAWFEIGLIVAQNLIIVGTLAMHTYLL